jgi:hypothetical protein
MQMLRSRTVEIHKKVELQSIALGVAVKEWPVVEWRLTFHDGTTQNWGFHMG